MPMSDQLVGVLECVYDDDMNRPDGHMLRAYNEALEHQRSDEFVWKVFMYSLATRGRNNWSDGSNLQQTYDDQVASAVLADLPYDEVYRRIANWLAGTRWAKSANVVAKTTDSFEKLRQRYGSIAAATNHARMLPTRDQKLAFLAENFFVLLTSGSLKYPRNFWLDAYDQHFVMSSFAIDQRLSGILLRIEDLPPEFIPIRQGRRKLLLPHQYPRLEQWLVNNLLQPLAQRLRRPVGLDFRSAVNAWHVDRLMFYYYRPILAQLAV